MTANLYIGDLPQNITEDFLKSFFAEAGVQPPISTVIKAHKILPYSFAFVNFEKHEDAAKVIHDLNYTKLDGKPIRILWNDPETKALIRSSKGALFINGLDEEIEVSQLHDAFSNFGEIISCKIPLSQSKSRGYGYIQFRREEDAEKAKTELSDASINGKAIQIEAYRKPAKKNLDDTFLNVYIKPLPAEHFKTDEDLKKLFEKYGAIQNPHLSVDASGKPLGFGFCNFVNHEDAVKAVNDLNGKEMYGVTFTCNRQMTKTERSAHNARAHQEKTDKFAKDTAGRNLYVKQFPKDITDEEFADYFKQFGEVERIRLERDENKEAKGYGYVLYKAKEAAADAISSAILFPFKGENLYISYWKTKNVRSREKAKKTVQQQHPTAPDMSMALPMTRPTYVPNPDDPKEALKQKLIARDIKGKQLKEMLIRVSDQQAKSLGEDDEKFERWFNLNKN